jgi:hypothetical protein
MDIVKRQENMAAAVAELKRLLEPGLLGAFTWFEAVEVIAMHTDASGDTQAYNVFSLYVAEPGERPEAPQQPFLNKLPWHLKGVKTWNFGITKRPVEISELFNSIKQYGCKGIWTPPSQKALKVGTLTAEPAMFCPSDSRTEIPLNGVLKNNFWAGSYVLELKDAAKSTLTDLTNNDALFEELCDSIAKVLPMNLGRVPDRLGDVLLQIPASALIAEFRRRSGQPVDLHLAWNPGVPQRAVVGEYRVEHDGIISSLARFDFPVGHAHLHIPPNSGDLRFSVWDSENQVVLAATAVLQAPDGKSFIESTWSDCLEQPRRFQTKKQDDKDEPHIVPLRQSGSSQQVARHQRPIVDWVARRELKTRMKQLIATKRFLQYGTGKANRESEHQRALEDLRHLIKYLDVGAIYLWDPYLSANDILNTLAFCENTGTELRGLTSSKRSKLGPADDDDDDRTNPAVTSRREDWIKEQQDQLKTAFTGPAHMKLEFRMSWGIQGSFHDRFLIFPGQGRHRTRAWSLGASINHIGSEHCIVQEVAYPEAVLNAFLNFWDQSSKAEHLVWKYS